LVQNHKEYIENYFKGKDLGVSITFNGQMHYFSTEALLEATLSSQPEVHKFVAQKLQVGSKKSIKYLMESIAETILKENMAG
jgi:hypothetical protein